MSNILIWGTGNIAQILMNRIDILGNKIVGFVDNNSQKHGKEFYGYGKIISPHEAVTSNYDIMIICASALDEIRQQCEKLKLENIYTYKEVASLSVKYPNILKNIYRDLAEEEVWKRCTYQAIKARIQPVINEMKEKAFLKDVVRSEEKEVYIWSCWWQGEEEAPFLVKKCFKSMREKVNSEKYKVIVISKDNWKDYIEIPRFVLEKVYAHVISLTHLSDIIRTKLLNAYGGLWFDATVYCAYQLDKDIFSYPFYSIKRETIYNSSSIITHAYVYSFMASKNFHFIFDYLERASMYYWQDAESLMTFYLFVYMLRIGYDEFEEIRQALDSCPINNMEYETLNTIMNDEYCEEHWKRMNENTMFFKLSNRKEYQEYTADGKLTYWGAFLRDII